MKLYRIDYIVNVEYYAYVEAAGVPEAREQFWLDYNDGALEVYERDCGSPQTVRVAPA